LEGLDVAGRTILKWFLKNRMGQCELDSCGSGYREMVGFCEHGSEISASINVWNFLVRGRLLAFQGLFCMEVVTLH
jgi:hypothetical protein